MLGHEGAYSTPRAKGTEVNESFPFNLIELGNPSLLLFLFPHFLIIYLVFLFAFQMFVLPSSP